MQSNAWHIDGLEASAPETGTAWVYTNPAMIEEIQVLGIGAGAEFGNMLGAAFNVVTKSGTNELKGTFNAYYQGDALTDSDIGFTESEFSEFEREQFWDVSATIGGPIVKDKVWFIGGYEYWRDEGTQPGRDPALTLPWKLDIYDLKISSHITPRNLLELKLNYQDWAYPTQYPRTDPSAQSDGEKGTNQMWGVNFQSVFTDRTFMEVRASGWNTDDDYLSATGSTEPAFIDYSPADGGTPTYHGGLLYPWVYETGTTQFDVTVSHFTEEFLKGDHDFKFGVRYGEGFSDAKTSLTGLYYYRYVYEYDYYGTIYPYEYFYKVDYNPYYYGADQTAFSVFVDDSWRLNDRTTLNLGLRFDRHDAEYPAYPRLDPGGVPTDEIIPGEPAFVWNNWSPRLGIAYNAGANYKTVIRGSVGIYYDGNVSGNWDSPPPDYPDWFYSISSSPTGPWEPLYVWNLGDNLIDPDLKAPQTTQYALGFERQFKQVYSYGLSVVYKDTKDLVGFEHMGDGVYEEVPWVDPLTGQQFTLWNEIEAGTVQKGNRPGVTAGGTFDEYNQKYWGVMLTFNRRFTDWWSLRASYTLSESTGLIPDLLDDTQFNPPYGNRDGADPNNFINGADQNLQGDRRHMFRVQANFELPWNMHASTAVNLQDGRPYSQQAVVRGLLNQGSVRFITVPASDSQRYPFQSLIDFSFGKRWNIAGNGILTTDIQIFNLLNDDAYDEFNGGGSEALVPDANGRLTPSWWVLPRRIMLRLGVEY